MGGRYNFVTRVYSSFPGNKYKEHDIGTISVGVVKIDQYSIYLTVFIVQYYWVDSLAIILSIDYHMAPK